MFVIAKQVTLRRDVFLKIKAQSKIERLESACDGMLKFIRRKNPLKDLLGLRLIRVRQMKPEQILAGIQTEMSRVPFLILDCPKRCLGHDSPFPHPIHRREKRLQVFRSYLLYDLGTIKLNKSHHGKRHPFDPNTAPMPAPTGADPPRHRRVARWCRSRGPRRDAVTARPSPLTPTCG